MTRRIAAATVCALAVTLVAAPSGRQHDGAVVRGTILFNGIAPRSPLLRVTLHAADRRDAVPPATAATQGPTFEISGVAAGKYELDARPFNEIETWRLEQVLVNGRDVTGRPFEVSSDVDGVVVRLTDRPASLTGTLRGPAAAGAALFPVDRSTWPDARPGALRFQMARVSRGTYWFGSVLHGEYYLAAIDARAVDAWPSPPLLEELVPRATRVIIAANRTHFASLEHQVQVVPRWWIDEPVRFLQTNLSENDSRVDPKALVDAVADFKANTYLVNMGGIVAQYPTRVPFHYASAFLPPGRDLFGEALRLAHARGIRVVGRFDLSKTQKPVYDAHPEWFFKRTNGEPAIYSGLYSACINGNYYREHAMTILSEALDRYEVDGLFFNMFGNPTSDYSGAPMGPCQCDACQLRYRARYGRPVPAQADADYRAFMADSSREVASAIAELIHRKRPRAAFLTYITDHTDGIMSESNTAIGRALPMWPYSASDNVGRALGTEPDKASINLSMAFVDFPWRYAHVSPSEMQLRLYQNIAHGGPPALAVVGTMDQQDRTGLAAAKPVFQWHAAHEDLYVGQKNAARVLLLSGGNQAAYRGFFRILTEQHIPFAVSENLRWMNDPARTYDLVISAGAAPQALAPYVRNGGRLLVAGTTPPPLPIGNVVGRKSTQGYWRVHDRALLPSLKDTDLLFVDGDYVELAPLEKPLLTLIPTAMFGPPEKVWSDKVETATPGLVFADVDKGRIAYVPWDIGGLYYRQSSPAHAALVSDVIDRLLPNGRQLKTDAHPLVEMTLMDQPSRRRAQIHLINGTGHHDTAYFPPVELRNIKIGVAREARKVTAVGLNRELPIARDGRFASFTLPSLGAYEVVIVE